jgi:uncharacterized protein YjiS (DUF1127 family)
MEPAMGTMNQSVTRFDPFHSLHQGQSKHLYDQLKEHWAEWRMRAFSRRELMTLDDHELRDIGLTRVDFEDAPNGPLWAFKISAGLVQPRLSNGQLIQAPADTR